MAGSPPSNNASDRKAVIGNKSNFWLYSAKDGFDLTHPPSPESPTIETNVRIETTTSPITIDPAKSALIIIDMQNFFLHPALRRKQGAGHLALDNLVEHAIPACRKAGIRIVWLNWGLTDQDVEEMPPAVLKDFGFEALVGGDNLAGQEGTLQEEKRANIYMGLGNDMGTFKDPVIGDDIEAGRMLMRDSWNAGLYPPLDKCFSDGANVSEPDVWIHKNRMSGMWSPDSHCCKFLEKEGIKTLFFSGVNTDQCVGGTYQDAFSKGYDCVLLSDGCGTTSPESAQKGIEYNAANTWGFMTTCKKLADGVGM